MPELPEVETIKRHLLSLKGATIVKAHLDLDNTCPTSSRQDFSTFLTGRRLDDFDRRGKFLIAKLSGGLYLVAHFRMTGTLVVLPLDADIPSHMRASFILDNGQVLYFNDPRKFGRLWLTQNLDLVLSGLGPEPFSDEFTSQYLQQKLGQSRKPIKSLLLEQDKVSGIGNMYADEALFLSGILPTVPAVKLTEQQYEKLHNAIRQALQSGIDNNGATVSDYHMPDGSVGHAQEHFFAAHRKGCLCKICGTEIRRMVVGGRGTYFCPYCQH
ncbi:MAG: DNA-formamidopyrimidine glycosylase [Chloroflexi bacterium]|nr:DNA-formamidopyrimidine glycosylase [Chloroflexota bacterium]